MEKNIQTNLKEREKALKAKTTTTKVGIHESFEDIRIYKKMG